MLKHMDKVVRESFDLEPILKIDQLHIQINQMQQLLSKS